MKLSELPLDQWVVVERIDFNEVNLLSAHETQDEAEVERDERNKVQRRHRYQAIKTLAPIAGAQGCAAVIHHKRGR